MVSRIHQPPSVPVAAPQLVAPPAPHAPCASTDLREQFRAQASLLQRLQVTGQLDASGTTLLDSVQEAITFLDQIIGGPLP